MSIEYIRKYYDSRAKRGGRVLYTGEGKERQGTITGSRNAHLLIRLDGEKRSTPFHPAWKLEYLSPTPDQELPYQCDACSTPGYSPDAPCSCSPKPTPEVVAWKTPYFETNRTGELVPIIVSVDGSPKVIPDDWTPLVNLSEAAAAIANLTAERDKWRDAWMKSAHDEAEAIRERDEAIERAEATEKRVKELEAELKETYEERKEFGDWQKEAARASRAEASNKLLSERVAVLEGIIAESNENIEALAKNIHDTDDSFFVPWMKQSPRYRSQERRKVRDVISAIRRALAAREAK